MTMNSANSSPSSSGLGSDWSVVSDLSNHHHGRTTPGNIPCCEYPLSHFRQLVAESDERAVAMDAPVSVMVAGSEQPPSYQQAHPTDQATSAGKDSTTMSANVVPIEGTLADGRNVQHDQQEIVVEICEQDRLKEEWLTMSVDSGRVSGDVSFSEGNKSSSAVASPADESIMERSSLTQEPSHSVTPYYDSSLSQPCSSSIIQALDVKCAPASAAVSVPYLSVGFDSKPQISLPPPSYFTASVNDAQCTTTSQPPIVIQPNSMPSKQDPTYIYPPHPPQLPPPTLPPQSFSMNPPILAAKHSTNVVNRWQQLGAQLHSLQDGPYSHAVQQLTGYFHARANELEVMRQDSLRKTTPTQTMMQSINCFFDREQLVLTDFIQCEIDAVKQRQGLVEGSHTIPWFAAKSLPASKPATELTQDGQLSVTQPFHSTPLKPLPTLYAPSHPKTVPIYVDPSTHVVSSSAKLAAASSTGHYTAACDSISPIPKLPPIETTRMPPPHPLAPLPPRSVPYPGESSFQTSSLGFGLHTPPLRCLPPPCVGVPNTGVTLPPPPPVRMLFDPAQQPSHVASSSYHDTVSAATSCYSSMNTMPGNHHDPHMASVQPSDIVGAPPSLIVKPCTDMECSGTTAKAGPPEGGPAVGQNKKAKTKTRSSKNATSKSAESVCNKEAKGNKHLNQMAIRIMKTWYQRNIRHPYPSQDTAEFFAKAGGITVEQVKKWFANKRMRSGNTKSLHEIALLRRKLSSVLNNGNGSQEKKTRKCSSVTSETATSMNMNPLPGEAAHMLEQPMIGIPGIQNFAPPMMEAMPPPPLLTGPLVTPGEPQSHSTPSSAILVPPQSACTGGMLQMENFQANKDGMALVPNMAMPPLIPLEDITSSGRPPDRSTTEQANMAMPPLIPLEDITQSGGPPDHATTEQASFNKTESEAVPTGL